MIERVKRSLRRQGYHLEPAIEQKDLLRISCKLGTPKTEVRNPELLRTLSPQPRELAKPNTLSSRFGTSAFPFHTDTAYWEMPARYILFYCLNPGAGKRPTLLADSRRWRLTVGQRENLYEEVWQTINGRPFLCTLMETSVNGPLIRWDEYCLRSVSRNASLGREIVLDFLNRIEDMRIDWVEGAMLVIDNHRLLHARGSAVGNDIDRVLKKILIAG